MFLLLAFARLGHKCQDLLSPWDGMHVCTDWTLVYRKCFGGMSQKPFLPYGEKKKLDSEEVRNRAAVSRRTASPSHYQLGYSAAAAELAVSQLSSSWHNNKTPTTPYITSGNSKF